MHPGASWCILVSPGASWRVLPPPGASWRILMHPGASWRILGAFWRIPMHSLHPVASCCILVHSGASWYSSPVLLGVDESVGRARLADGMAASQDALRDHSGAVLEIESGDV